MRLMTFNANGLRAAAKKGFWEWFAERDVDVLCVQELKAQEADLKGEVRDRPGYESFLHCAQRRGYAGTGVWTRLPVVSASTGFGTPEFDDEGRYTSVDLGPVTVVSLYAPSGSMNDDRQASKDRFLEVFLPHMAKLMASGKEIVVCGDVNIAHKEIDLKNWKGNQKNSGFLPHERAWMTRLIDELGWVDVFRKLDPAPERYTWWSQRGQARAKNVGWRIDYQLATPGLAACAYATDIAKDPVFSDHAPFWIDYDLSALGKKE